MYNVVLYYYFHPIDDITRFCLEHKQQCLSLGLLGRVYIAHEGINGTLAGTEENMERYKNYVWSLPGFEKTEFKEARCDYVPFRKLVVKTRPEIVALKVAGPVDPAREPAPRLMPHEWRKVLESGEDYVLIDTRNNYEWEIGHFEGAVLPEVENFYDFPAWVDRARIDKQRKVLMYCTGGIRCEKFSIVMRNMGYTDVYQLHGGIINYAEKEGGAHYQGKCFVFDDRLAVPVNKEKQGPISRCAITGVPCDTYINCANPDCNKLFICSPGGIKNMEGCCGEPCRQSPRRRPLDADNIFAPTRKWYHYFTQKV
jgi:UPF0176 protein